MYVVCINSRLREKIVVYQFSRISFGYRYKKILKMKTRWLLQDSLIPFLFHLCFVAVQWWICDWSCEGISEERRKDEWTHNCLHFTWSSDGKISFQWENSQYSAHTFFFKWMKIMSPLTQLTILYYSSV